MYKGYICKKSWANNFSTNIHGKIFLRCYGGERQSAAPGISEPLQTLLGLKKRKVIPLTLRTAWGGGGGVHPPWTTFFYNSRTTCAILMKLCPSEQNLVRNILKSKCPPHVSSEHAQMVYFLGQSDFTDQDL